MTIQQGDHPLLLLQPKKQRRPGPKNPKYGIPPEHWPDVVRRIEQGESLRTVARDYNVSYETIRRVLRSSERQGKGGDA